MNIEKAREEFEAAYVEDMVRIIGKGIRQRAFDNTKLVMQNGDFQDPALRLAFWAWQAGAKPLVAESERNAKNAKEWEAASLHWMAERDELKRENEELRKGIDPKWATMDQTFVIEFLRNRSVFDADNIDRMMQFATESAQYVVLNPGKEAPANPPACPENEFDDIPDFGGGSGNKARRRAEAVGIDYDAAMRKESRHD